MRILVITPPVGDPLALAPHGLAVAEHLRGLGHAVETADANPQALEARLAPVALSEGIAAASRRFQDLERSHTLSGDDAVLHRSLADVVPVAEVVGRRLPGARTRLFTSDAWTPRGTGAWPPALADATVLRVALALSSTGAAVAAADAGTPDLGENLDRVVIAVSAAWQVGLAGELAERIRRGGCEAVIARAPWVGPGEGEGPPVETLDPGEGIDPRARIPVWAPWESRTVPPVTYVRSLAGGRGRPEPTAEPPGDEVVGIELRLDPDVPDRDLIRWAGETDLPVRIRVPRGGLARARERAATLLGDVATRPGLEIEVHPIGATPGPETMPPRSRIFDDHQGMGGKVSWPGFAAAVRMVQAGGRSAFRYLMDRCGGEPPSANDPLAPDAVPRPSPDAVVVRLTHDPTLVPQVGGVGRTAGEQVAAGLTPGRGHPFAYDLARGRRIRLTHPAHAVAPHVDGKRSVAEIARAVSGGSADDRLVARTAEALAELARAGVVSRP